MPNCGKGSRRRRYRRAALEALEPRLLLSGNQNPTLAAIPDVVVYGGAPLHLALDGFDPDGDALTFEVSVTNGGLVTPVVSQANPSLRLSVANYGDMVFQLFQDLVPNTTSRIVELVQDGFYNGLSFHRVVNDFVIQTGDPTATGSGGSGTTVDDEFHPLLQHTSSGILAMAKSIDDSNDSQFYITAQPTRHLDFNHAIFGFLTEGEAVRHAIEQVPVDASSKPTTPVQITQATIFQDQENAVLRLIAPDGTTGQTDVTVTVRDGKGGEATQTFTVTVLPDSIDNYPYLSPIDPIVVASGGSTTFQIPAHDVDGGAIFYAASVSGSDSPLTVNVDSTTGTVTITAQSGSHGVAGIYVDVRAENPSGYFSGRDVWDSQLVPVYIAPPAPQSVLLTAGTDSGLSDSDGITNRDNGTDAELRFHVLNVVPGAQITLLMDGQEAAQGTAAFSDITLQVPSSFGTLSEGSHTVTVRQSLVNIPVEVGNFHSTTTLHGPAGAPYSFTIDKTPPSVTSSPPSAIAVGQQLNYDVQTVEEAAGGVRYSVFAAPAGLTVHPDTGLISWSPTPSQTGSQTVTIRTTDVAGNAFDHTFTVQVRAAPQITGIPSPTIYIDEGDTLSLALGTSGDPSYAPYHFALIAGPSGMSLDEDTGQLIWATDESHGPGTYSVTVEVLDREGAAGRSSFQVVVNERNAPPVLSPVADPIIAEGESLQITLSASDPDSPQNPLRYRLLGTVPQGMTVDAATGELRWTPDETYGGQTVEVEVEVRDRESSSDLDVLADRVTFQIHVEEVDAPPVWQSLPTVTVFPGQFVRLQLSAQDPDIPAVTVRYSADTPLPDGAVLDSATGVFAWRVPDVFSDDLATVLRFRATEDSTQALFATVDVRLIIIDPRAAVAPGSASRESDFAQIPAPGGNTGGNSGIVAFSTTAGLLPRSFQPQGGASTVGGLTPTRYLLFTGPGSGSVVSPPDNAPPANPQQQRPESSDHSSEPAKTPVPENLELPRGKRLSSRAARGFSLRRDSPLEAVVIDRLLGETAGQGDGVAPWKAASVAEPLLDDMAGMIAASQVGPSSTPADQDRLDSHTDGAGEEAP